ncbi:MAG: hypothetical protein M1832_002065 [Thelocarpon impressellum]|nr:MAG: hypothetical protein M1832_002065 [Thelocarpon impressellum]
MAQLGGGSVTLTVGALRLFDRLSAKEVLERFSSTERGYEAGVRYNFKHHVFEVDCTPAQKEGCLSTFTGVLTDYTAAKVERTTVEDAEDEAPTTEADDAEENFPELAGCSVTCLWQPASEDGSVFVSAAASDEGLMRELAKVTACIVIPRPAETDILIGAESEDVARRALEKLGRLERILTQQHHYVVRHLVEAQQAGRVWLRFFPIKVLGPVLLRTTLVEAGTAFADQLPALCVARIVKEGSEDPGLWRHLAFKKVGDESLNPATWLTRSSSVRAEEGSNMIYVMPEEKKTLIQQWVAEGAKELSDEGEAVPPQLAPAEARGVSTDHLIPQDLQEDPQSEPTSDSNQDACIAPAAKRYGRVRKPRERKPVTVRHASDNESFGDERPVSSFELSTGPGVEATEDDQIFSTSASSDVQPDSDFLASPEPTLTGLPLGYDDFYNTVLDTSDGGENTHQPMRENQIPQDFDRPGARQPSLGSSSPKHGQLLDFSDDDCHGGFTEAHPRGLTLDFSAPPLIPEKPTSPTASREPNGQCGGGADDEPTVTDKLQVSSEVDSRVFRHTMGQQKARGLDEREILSHRTLLKLRASAVEMLELAQSHRGILRLEVEIGRIMLHGIPPKLAKPFTLDEWDSTLAQEGGRATETFTSMLTTSVEDTERIMQLVDADKERLFKQEPSASRIFYEFVCSNQQGEEITVEVNAEDFRYQVRKSSRLYGSAYLHYPKRNWDARLNVVGLAASRRDEEAARALVDNLYVPNDGALPNVFTLVNPKHLQLHYILAKRQIRHPVRNERVALQLTQVQDLVMHHHVSIRGATHASARPAADMVADPSGTRLWYEASLISLDMERAFQENIDLELGEDATWRPEDVLQNSLERLWKCTTDVVTRIDGVGAGNVGPAGLKMPSPSPPPTVAPPKVAKAAFW